MRSLQDRRLWIGGGVVAALLIALAGWLFAISPQLSAASSLRSQAQDVDTQAVVLEAKINTLRKKSEQSQELVASLKSALAALPTDTGLPDLTRQLSAQAAAAGVSLTSIAVGTVTSATTPAPTTTGAGTAAAAGGTIAIPITLISTGSLTQQLSFLNAVQADGPRRALVSSTQVAPGTGATEASIDGAATFTTQLTVFAQPQSAQQVAQLNKLLAGNFGK
jgi:hypothetical protein